MEEARVRAKIVDDAEKARMKVIQDQEIQELEKQEYGYELNT